METLPSVRSPKPMPESRRHREVYVRYGAVLNNIPRLHLTGSHEGFATPSDHTPRQSVDPSLAAFAQLACLQSGTSRAIVSLIDDSTQHVIAEATPDLLLRSSRETNSNRLWLGTASVPRKWTPCEAVLESWTSESASPQAVVTFRDLLQTEEYAQRSFVTASPFARFYAGVPLVSPKGAVVGTLSVMDDKPRAGLEKHQLLYLQDLAVTVVEYLDLYMIREQFSRAEKLMRALMSFTEGGSVMRPFENESQRQLAPSGAELPEPQKERSTPALAKPPIPSPSPVGRPPKPDRQNSVSNLQESILPTDSRSMFSRAAKVIQESSDLDGVFILDASVVGSRVNHDSFVASGDVSDGFSSGESSSSSPEDNGEGIPPPIQRRSSATAQKTSQVLGFATVNHSDFEGHSPPPPLISFSEKDLSRLFRTYPEGKIINISFEGEPISSTDESDSASILGKVSGATSESTVKKKTETDVKFRLALSIRKILPEALSVAFTPLWDYERSRWFAGCLCWSNRTDRILSERVDLAYFKIFGHSIMTDLSRLDALAADRAKSSFVASISHELRSPLHGILGTLRFLEDTALDAFQVSMINSLGSCGRTLLDTIDHVLDYANVTATKKTKSWPKKPSGQKANQGSSKGSKGRKRKSATRTPALDLKRATEETIEAVISGQSYTLLEAQDWDDSPPLDTPSRKSDRYIVLHIAEEENWNHHIDSGSWRRVVMNLIGNSLKYTDSGYIQISLRCSHSVDDKVGRNVYLTIKDTGHGISQNFLVNHAFQPFRQENTHSPGTGLGLSIVRQIIDSLGGDINMASAPGSGTEVRIRLTLSQPDDHFFQPRRTQSMTIMSQLQGKRIYILNQSKTTESKNENGAITQEGMDRFTTALAYTLSKHLKMEVIQTSQWDQCDADLVICPEPHFSYLASIRRQTTIGSRAPVTVFVAMDALEAATLRTDVRVRSKESVVEIMAQPCGPHKLAHVLEICLNRFASPEENIWSPISATPSPLPSLARPLPIRNNTIISSSNANASNTSISREETASSPSTLRHKLPVTSLTTSISTDDTESSKVPPGQPKPAKIGPLSGPQPATIDSTDAKGGVTMSPTVETSSGLSTSSDPTKPKTDPSRVLIVDDNPVNRKLLVTFLGKRNMPYAEAENGAEAVRIYQEASPVQFDVILMDLSMPVLDGISATRQIRDYEQQMNGSRACIIALTGLASASARLEAWSSSVNHYMTKPVNFKKLGAVLDEEAAKGR